MEKNELNTLIGKGAEFEINDIEFRKKRILGFFRKRVPVPVTRKFKIEEPTLGTLDRLSAEFIDFEIDENSLNITDVMKTARTLAGKHAIRCAKIIALAVMGSDYQIPTCNRNGIVRYVKDDKRLNELTALFARTIKPSQLYQLYILINTMFNLGDFTNSIRLMSADRTTMPIRIEPSNGV